MYNLNMPEFMGESGSAFDNLGIEEQLKQVKYVIEHCIPPYAIGILGEWGQGKSTFMRILQERIQSTGQVTVWFDSWKYDLSEPLLGPLLFEIETQTLAVTKAMQERIKESDRKRLSAAWRHAATGIAALFQLSNAAESFFALYDITRDGGSCMPADSAPRYSRITELKQELESCVAETLKAARPNEERAKLIVFIDDLDRCSPERALELLDHCRIHFEVKNVVFVYGMNPNAIQHAVQQKYGESLSGAAYLQKIVNIDFELMHTDRPSKMLEEFAKKILPEGTEVPSSFIEHVINAFTQLGKVFNPRIAKRVLARFAVSALNGPSESLEVSAILGVLREYHPYEYPHFADRSTLQSYVDGWDTTHAGGKTKRESLGTTFDKMHSCGLPRQGLQHLLGLLPKPRQ